MASVSRDGSVCLWNSSNGKLRFQKSLKQGELYSVSWQRGGRFVAVGSRSQVVSVWDTHWNPITTINRGNAVYQVRWLPGDKHVLAAYVRGEGCCFFHFDEQLSLQLQVLSNVEPGYFDWTSSGDGILVSGREQVVTIDANTGEVVNRMPVSHEPFLAEVHGDLVAIGTRTGWLSVFSYPDWSAHVSECVGAGNVVPRFSPDGKLLVCTTSDGKGIIMETANWTTHEKQLKTAANFRRTLGLAFHPSRNEFATLTNNNREIQLWRYAQDDTLDPRYDVFLSYSSKDRAAVRELAQRLRQDGLKVWFDEWQIRAGDPILTAIDQGLEDSRCLVFVMSQHAFDSDWATLESHTVRFQDPLNSSRRFIPLRLDDSPIRTSLQIFNYIDWRNKSDGEYKRLLDRCTRPNE